MATVLNSAGSVDDKMSQIECDNDVLAIKGALTQKQVLSLWQSRPDWLAPKIKKMDLYELTEIDSAGLALLLELEACVAEAGTQLIWFGVPNNLTRLMELYNLQLQQDRLASSN